ncbi:MAG: tRNA (N(6)-L-threonylcarbamoyladenosine(37)-C(2))-methylthiotransferase MtaB [Treponema sp.]|nr:tRNA (N(6)-L-threonylcarbamoyladenosine(37)-C(2))-methylthiotransferase MtaB [Treponema sp.]
MPSFLVKTLGCKLNQLESESIIDAFFQRGFNLSGSNDTNPSIVVINTCTVTSKADQKARNAIRKALKDFPDSRVIVTGCYAQLDKDELQKLETDNKQRLFVVGKDKIISFLQNLSDLGTNKPDSLRASVPPCDNKTINQFEFNPSRFSAHTRSFIKIQDGCDKQCTYCRIRLARGPSISLETDEILSRLKVLEQNYTEAVISGVNICQYRGENGQDLAGLLDYLLKGTKKIALRLSSLEPDYIDENLVKVLSDKRIRPHFHLSIQSLNKKILERMGRSYNAQTVKNAIALLRSAKESPFLACDIIAGFPGETKTEFNETYKTCKELNFAWIHVFPFSRRPGTKAFEFSDNIKESEVTKRVKIITDLAEQGRAEYVRSWLGREVDVLVEKSGKYCKGITENYLKVQINTKEKFPPPGTVLKCRLTEEGNYKDYAVKAIII